MRHFVGETSPLHNGRRRLVLIVFAMHHVLDTAQPTTANHTCEDLVSFTVLRSHTLRFLTIGNKAKVVRLEGFMRALLSKRNLQAVLAMILAIFGIGSRFRDQDLNFLHRPSRLVGS